MKNLQIVSYDDHGVEMYMLRADGSPNVAGPFFKREHAEATKKHFDQSYGTGVVSYRWSFQVGRFVARAISSGAAVGFFGWFAGLSLHEVVFAVAIGFAVMLWR